MKAFFIFLALLFAIQANAQRPEPVSTAGRNQSPIDPTQLQPPQDTEPPVVVCSGTQDFYIHLTGAITVWDTDFISSVSDNVTPEGELKFAIRKAGTGIGYPLDSIGNSITSVTFSCAEIGLQQVEIWAIDAANNAGNCTTEVLISDQFGFCIQSYDSVVLCAKRHCDNAPMQGISYSLEGTANFVPPFNQIPQLPFTDTLGCVLLYIREGITATLTMEKDDDLLNGVNTLDMLLIAKHIQGIEPFTDPYRLIAADANKSGSVSTIDLVEFQKLIKGIYSELPNNTSWRFIDGSFHFPNPLNPFVTSFPEAMALVDTGGLPDSVLYYGIKIGDVNCSATLDSLAPINYPDAELVIKDTLLQVGQVYEIPIYMGSGGQWGGYQFGLSFDPAKLEFVDVTPTQWSDATDWAFFPGRVSTSWIHAPFPVSWQANEPMAILRMKALQPLQLSTVMQLETNGLHAEAYKGQEALTHDLTLHFEPQFKAPEFPVADKINPGPDPTQLGDFAAPVITCINGLSANIMPTGLLTLWTADFLQAVSDNATTVPSIEIGIRRAGTGTGFPEDALGLPISNVLFICPEIGSQGVELWARDLAGNTAYCETSVLLMDNLGNCNAADWNVAICAKTETAEGVEENQYIVTGNNPTGPFYANPVGDPTSGCGYFDVALGSNITVSVLKDDNPLNGVTTFDMILIAKHIEGVEPLNTPYKIIAADVDKSGFIDSTDITELYKLILGINTAFPNNTSWRFVPWDFVFQDPTNPFITPFPESVTIQNLQFTASVDFVAIKVGDVNGSAANNASLPGEDRDLATKKPFIGNAVPNPTPAGAIIPMELYAPVAVTLGVYTLQGQLVWMNQLELPAGAHALEIPEDILHQPGAYVWRVRTGETVKTGKIVVK
ncbi:MAG: T9SS type A sorting domain-containing protein [Saprospiraceae bacterium]|nr:T9SS type A sorting domain-containing protein [Saprospiraceae bacterium]